eukprot:m.19479 g.19479  ORF g.19479 m.19479 type:complete len:1962 (-) comp6594_c0_seq1:161-6046(-)
MATAKDGLPMGAQSSQATPENTGTSSANYSKSTTGLRNEALRIGKQVLTLLVEAHSLKVAEQHFLQNGGNVLDYCPSVAGPNASAVVAERKLDISAPSVPAPVTQVPIRKERAQRKRTPSQLLLASAEAGFMPKTAEVRNAVAANNAAKNVSNSTHSTPSSLERNSSAGGISNKPSIGKRIQIPTTPGISPSPYSKSASSNETNSMQLQMSASTSNLLKNSQPYQKKMTMSKSNPTTPLSNTHKTTPTLGRPNVSSQGELIVSTAAHTPNKREAAVLSRIAELKAAGLWSSQRLPKLAEPSRQKMHWDYLLEEMSWLANDFRMERKWKMALARKTAKLVMKWHEAKAQKEARELKAELARKKKVAGNVAREATKFWKQMLQVVAYKQKLELDSVKKEALERHLDFIVGQTERFTKELKGNMGAPVLPGQNLTKVKTEENRGAPKLEEKKAISANIQPSQSTQVSKEGEKSPKATDLADTRTTAEAADEEEKQALLDTGADDEFVPEEVGPMDDETSMAEADEPQNAEQELDTLANDADMSLEELLRMYPGYGGGEDAQEDDGKESEKQAPDEAEPESEHDSPRSTRSRKRRRNESPSVSETESVPPPTRSSRRKAASRGTRQSPRGKSESVATADETAENKTENSAAESTPPPELEASAAKADKFQPGGCTLEDVQVKTRIPLLFKGKLRQYQHIGLDWLVNMHGRKLNGILADEMGLGKTIQTISLLAYLASEKGNWGPHLIIVPTTVMLNWELEFKKFCPGFKILTYFGTMQERKQKRQGWSKPDAFHVCITSYKLAVQDNQAFRRRKWRYLILDEAHQIKNFQSKRWQTLLGFNSRRRLLLTGTPLQNNLMELWSLMHFLMPHIFQSHAQFKEWFGTPVGDMVDTSKQQTKEQQLRDKERVHRLHTLLRPFILRRLKADVEKQLPSKYEHVVACHLSKRQRQLYDDFLSRSKTKESLSSGNYMNVMNILMQLRKVCNHPNLFAEPVVESPFVMSMFPLQYPVPALVMEGLRYHPATGIRNFEFTTTDTVDLRFLNLCLLHHEVNGLSYNPTCVPKKVTIEELDLPVGYETLRPPNEFKTEETNQLVVHNLETQQKALLRSIAYINGFRRDARPLIGARTRQLVTVYRSPFELDRDVPPGVLQGAVVPLEERKQTHMEMLNFFTLYLPPVLANPPDHYAMGTNPVVSERSRQLAYKYESALCLRKSDSELLGNGLQTPNFMFPDRRLIQYDCGKLQKLEELLRTLKAGDHRTLIFTQMSKMLDILEHFLAYHGYTYVRLDGATGIEKRQKLMDRFNRDKRIFCFILSTRSGGTGVNLVGADTVIFYDSDWNPTMDAQAQDRCHRIGQTRDVHIYRLVSEKTVEENILKKANQKRMLGNLAIEEGSFNTEFFSKTNLKSFFTGDDEEEASSSNDQESKVTKLEMQKAMLDAEDESDRKAASAVLKEQADELQEFDESKAFPDDPAKANSSASEAESGPEDENLDLQAQLERLRGVELHALTVLERYLTPAHQARLEEARRAVQEKDSQFKEIEERIREQQEAMISEDEEELFFDKDEAYKVYMEAATADAKLYAPPNPSASDEVYIEPAHVMQYRVGYMTFKPLPNPELRRKKRRKKRSSLKRPHPNENQFLNTLIDRKKLKTMSMNPIPVPSLPHKPATKSLFRKLDDVRAQRTLVKVAKHPKRMLKNMGKEQRKDIDSNKDAPPWTIEEDFHLLQAVKAFLSHTGSVNWVLVSDTVNSSTSFTGRFRSRNQCRDRYFRNILPREEGKGEGRIEPTKKKKKSKDGPNPLKVPKLKQISTQKQYDQDGKESVKNFHTSCFIAVQKAVQQMRKSSKGKRWEPHSSHETVSKRIQFPQTGPYTPVYLSDVRHKKLLAEAEAKASQRHRAQQRVKEEASRSSASATGHPSAGTLNRGPVAGSPSAQSGRMHHSLMQQGQARPSQGNRNSSATSSPRMSKPHAP